MAESVWSTLATNSFWSSCQALNHSSAQIDDAILRNIRLAQEEIQQLVKETRDKTSTEDGPPSTPATEPQTRTMSTARPSGAWRSFRSFVFDARRMPATIYMMVMLWIIYEAWLQTVCTSSDDNLLCWLSDAPSRRGIQSCWELLLAVSSYRPAIRSLPSRTSHARTSANIGVTTLSMLLTASSLILTQPWALQREFSEWIGLIWLYEAIIHADVGDCYDLSSALATCFAALVVAVCAYPLRQAN